MKHTKYLALAALLICSACANTPGFTDAQAPQENTSQQWQYANIQTIAKPNNTFLIMMR